MRQPHSTCALLALLTLASTPGMAQQQTVPNAVSLEAEVEEIREYSVELIIFEYVGTAAGSVEIFDPEALPDPDAEPDLSVTLPDRLTAKRQRVPTRSTRDPVRSRLIFGEPEELELIPTFEQAGFRRLPEEEFQLTNAYDQLVRLDAYRPIIHAGWTQPTVDQADTMPVELRRISDPPLRLDGTFSLYLSRFLHLVVDLALEEQSAEGTTTDRPYEPTYGSDRGSYAYGLPIDQPSTYFRIQEDRIMRNDEVRYFDHPKFGVIARVTRVEQSTEDELDTTGDLLPGIGN
jgi:hypothetical protein